MIALGSDPTRVYPMVGTADIAALPADLLADRTWTGQQNVPVFGPDRLTPPEIAVVVPPSAVPTPTPRAWCTDVLAPAVRSSLPESDLRR